MPPQPKSAWRRDQDAELANIVRWLRERADALQTLAAQLEEETEVEAAQHWLAERAEVAAAIRMIEEGLERCLRMSFEIGALSMRDYPAYRRQGPGSLRRLKRRPRCPKCRAIETDTRLAGSASDGDRLISRCGKGHVWGYVGLGQ